MALSEVSYEVGGIIDIGTTPDQIINEQSLTATGYIDVTVTQKPRFIVMAITGKDNNYPYCVGFADIENERGWKMGASSVVTAGYSLDWSPSVGGGYTYADYFPIISDTTVRYNCATWGGNHKLSVMIYY